MLSSYHVLTCHTGQRLPSVKQPQRSWIFLLRWAGNEAISKSHCTGTGSPAWLSSSIQAVHDCQPWPRFKPQGKCWKQVSFFTTLLNPYWLGTNSWTIQHRHLPYQMVRTFALSVGHSLRLIGRSLLLLLPSGLLPRDFWANFQLSKV